MQLPSVPLIPLGILWMIYAMFGWLLGEATSEWLIWLLAVCFIVLMALVFTAPSSMVRNVFTNVLQSDSRAFLSVIVTAMAVVLMVNWLPQFVRLVVLLSAGALARLELQSAEYGEWQSFTIMVLMSLAGFATGLGGYFYFHPSDVSAVALVVAH